MLVLSRKTHQRIRLGDAIVVTVIGVAGNRVRLGIEAPDGVRVLREELQFVPEGGAQAGSLVGIASGEIP